MAITAKNALLNNQSILQNFALGEEVDEQTAEIISGGEKFIIKNNTDRAITYTLDGAQVVIQPGREQKCVTQLNGDLRFDRDIRDERVRIRDYDLEDGETYEFRRDPRNSNRIDLFDEDGY